MTSAIFGSILAILTISVLGLMIYRRYKDSQLQTDEGMLKPEQFAFSTVHQASRGCEITETTQAWSWQSVGVDQFGNKKWQQPPNPTLDRVADAKTLYRIESCNTGKFSGKNEGDAYHEWLTYKPDIDRWPCEPFTGQWKSEQFINTPEGLDAVGVRYSVWIIKPNARRPWLKDLYLPDMRNTQQHYDTKAFVRTAIQDRLEIDTKASILTDLLKEQGCFTIKKAGTDNYFSRYCTPKTISANREVVNGQAVCDFEARSITASSTLDEKSATAWRFEPLCPGIESIVAPSWNRLSGTEMPITLASKDNLFRIESCAKRGHYIAYKPTNPSTWSCNPTLAEGEWKLVSIPDEDEVQYSVFIKKDSKIYLAIPSEGKYLDWEVTAGSKLQLFSGEIIPSLHTFYQTPTYTDAYKTYTGNCKSFKRATNGGYIAYSATDSLYDVVEDPQGNVAFPVRPSASWRFEEL